MKPRNSIFIYLHLLFFHPTYCAQRVSHTAACIPRHAATADQLARKLHRTFPNQRCKLERACKLFETTPGFRVVLQNIAQCKEYPNAKGYWYELEKALALHRTHRTDHRPIVVRSFGTVKQSPTSNAQREFDIIAQINEISVFYECKNMRWISKPSQLENQFRNQQHIVAALARRGKKVNYVVASKQPIPPRWRKFFERHQITTEVD